MHHVESVFSWALTLGLLQGFGHCAGMCGPFLLAFGTRLATVPAPSPDVGLVQGPIPAPDSGDFARSVSPTSFASPAGVPSAASSGSLAASLPPVAAVGPRIPTRLSDRWPLVGYHHAGRITAFTLLGTLAGSVGRLADLAAGARRLDSVAAVAGGFLMLAWAVDQARTGRGGRILERYSLLGIPGFAQLFRRASRARGQGSAFGAGFLLGVHPCGVIFALWLAAAASASPFLGALTLLGFGLGTLPSLLGVSAAGLLGQSALRGPGFRLVTAGFVALSGLLFLLRGLAFDRVVPSLTPWLF